MKNLKKKKKEKKINVKTSQNKKKTKADTFEDLSIEENWTSLKLKNESVFKISGLNQEKLLNELSKSVPLYEIDRKAKNDTTFKCSYFDHKKVAKFLKNKNVKVEALSHDGAAFKFKKALSCWGLIAAVVLSAVLYFFQSGFVLQYEINGVDKLSHAEVVQFVKGNFSNKKAQIDTKRLETALVKNFNEISFASCMIKGQTLVINIKEKLLPNEMYGEFAPIKAQKDGKITKINLISGTLKVKVGDFVRKGDELVLPYTIDTSGQMKKVEAKAEIWADVYNMGSVSHQQRVVEVKRTGRVAMQNEIVLFGLSIYTFKENHNFKMFEVMKEEVNLAKNLFLPFKLKKSYIYETAENVIESCFEDVKDQFVEKAKQKALENCTDYAKMKEEFYTTKQLAGVTVVNFCIVTEEAIGWNLLE